MDTDKPKTRTENDTATPLRTEQPAAPTGGRISSANWKPRTVLIVDDISVMRLRLRPQLEEAGYRVLEAEDGERALDIVRSETEKPEGAIDLIVTDLTMPVMDGLEFIRRLRLESRFAAIPVIVCTARGEIAIVRKAKQLGVQGFLVKPITKPTLLAAIRRELR